MFIVLFFSLFVSDFKYLRKNADLYTIAEIEKEKIKEAVLVCNLTNSPDMKGKQCEEIKKNIRKAEA